MGRRAKQLHELIPVPRSDRPDVACVHWNRRRYDLGPWDQERGRPTPEAERNLILLKQRLLAGPQTDCEYLISAWQQWIESDHAPRKRSLELRRCRVLLFGTSSDPRPAVSLRIEEFTAVEFQEVVDRLCQLRGDDGELVYSDWTRADTIRLYRRFFDWCRRRLLIGAEQYGMLQLVQPAAYSARKRTRITAGVDWDRLDQVASSLRSEAGSILRVLWHTGARASEVCRLHRSQIQTVGVVENGKGSRVVLQDHGVWAAVLKSHKTAHRGQGRILFFGPESQRVMAPMMGRAGPVFQKGNGVAYLEKDLLNYCKRSCRSLGVDRFTPRSIRHAALTRFRDLVNADGGSGDNAASAIAGHVLRDRVTGIYTGLDILTAARVIARHG